MQRILVVDDDRDIASLIADALSDEGFVPLEAHDGEAALRMISRYPDISLIILDIMMPGMDGLEVCRRIRDQVGVPILFVTAKNRVVDTLLGLELGADDYIQKPFVVEELVARVKAHLRREQRRTRQPHGDLRFGGLVIRPESYEATLNGVLLELSTREFQVLLYLCENVGKVLSREQIFSAVWGGDFGDIGAVAVNIKNLRDKMDPNHRLIKTVWGVGYKLVPPAEGTL